MWLCRRNQRLKKTNKRAHRRKTSTEHEFGSGHDVRVENLLVVQPLEGLQATEHPREEVFQLRGVKTGRSDEAATGLSQMRNFHALSTHPGVQCTLPKAEWKLEKSERVFKLGRVARSAVATMWLLKSHLTTARSDVRFH